jgi:zinc/manganese transport system permease protein
VTYPFSWNLIADIQDMWSLPSILNAFRAGTVVAVLGAVVGWFMVLRRQSFAGHTLAVVGFPGAAGATLIGVASAYGYFGFCLAAALVIAALPRGRDASRSEESAVTGTVQAFALACGYLFIALYKGFLGGVNALLFGNFLGITSEQVAILLLVALVALVVLAVVGRPLLYASIDPEVAEARGLPVRALSTAFLVLLGAAVAEASQITGTLLVFALLVMPAATAQLVTARPVLSMALTVLIGTAATWLGLGIAYFSPYPIGFCVTTVAFAGYVLAQVARVGVPRLRLAGSAA